MVYLWERPQREKNLARYGLDFIDAVSILEGTHRRLFQAGPPGAGVGYYAITRLDSLPLTVHAVDSADGNQCTILEFRPAFRWETALYDQPKRSGERVDPPRSGADAPPRTASLRSTTANERGESRSDWSRFDRNAWPEPVADEREWELAEMESAQRRNARAAAGRERQKRRRRHESNSESISDTPGVAIAPAKRKRGRPVHGAPKRQTTLRIPHSVLKRWRGSGKGWQTRMVERLAAQGSEARADDAPGLRLDLPAPPPRKRGLPALGDVSESITLRIPQDVLARWKATGRGWQTRMVARLSEP